MLYFQDEIDVLRQAMMEEYGLVIQTNDPAETRRKLNIARAKLPELATALSIRGGQQEGEIWIVKIEHLPSSLRGRDTGPHALEDLLNALPEELK